MAIEKTTFTATGNATNVYNWLLANATEYFESVEQSGNFINCKFKGCNTAKLTLYTGNSDNAIVSITLENGTTIAGAKKSSGIEYFDYLVKTDYGIYIHTSDSKNSNIMISKDNGDNVCVSFLNYTNNTKTHNLVSPLNNLTYDVTSKVMSTSLSVFSPIPFGATYSDNLLFTPFSDIGDFVGKITDDNGQKYWYDGYCAIKE